MAKVTKVSRHPKSDRLKVCQLDSGSGTVQVVTNAAGVTAGMAIILAVCGPPMRCRCLRYLQRASPELRAPHKTRLQL